MPPPNSRLARRVAPLALSAIAPCALAQHADDRGWFHIAGYRPTIESIARADLLATDRPGTEVRFEDELGLADRKTLPWIQAGARLGDRWRLELEYFSLRRSGSRTLAREIDWGGTVFPATADVSSSFDSDILRASVGYSFVRSANAELGGVLGLHTTRFRIGLATQASVGDTRGSGQSEAEDATVPLPTIGLYGTSRFGENWFVAGRVDYFNLRFGDYEGGLVNAMAALGYRLTDRFSVSAGYRYVDYSLDVDRTNWRGSVDYRFSGPFVSLQLGS